MPPEHDSPSPDRRRDLRRDEDVSFARLIWRLDALDEWRNKHVDPCLVKLEDRVDKMASAQAIADAVAHRLDNRRRLEWTLVQKIAAGAFGLVLFIGALLSLVQTWEALHL